MRTSDAALSCVAHLYCRIATTTQSSAVPYKTAMRNADALRTPSLSIVLFLTLGEARIRFLAQPSNYVALHLEASEIGRASCRERVYISVVSVFFIVTKKF